VSGDAPEGLGPFFDDVERECQELERADRQRRCDHRVWLDVTVKGDATARERCVHCGLEREVVS
jgi:hypothetical protein